ncbi:MAG: hypothetical protein DWQ05_00310 [Calditrichaeota bacterium]|nr:MAG: hypothetical protein DWQ05_00310 [Calditrichota bacterium]
MAQGSLMVRMIDVVFILLFGFIAVSQISKAEAIEPSKSTEAEAKAPEGAYIAIINVRSNGVYTADGGDTILRNTNEVRRYLSNEIKKAKADKKQLGVRIRSSWDAPARKTLAVAKVCRGLDIPKGLDVVKIRQF